MSTPINLLLLFQRMCTAKNSGTTSNILFEPLTENLLQGDRPRHIIDVGFQRHKVVWGRIETFDLIYKTYSYVICAKFWRKYDNYIRSYMNDMRLAGIKTS